MAASATKAHSAPNIAAVTVAAPVMAIITPKAPAGADLAPDVAMSVLAILSLLAEAPANGYSLIGQISDRTDGRWRPSPGSIYPVLRQLTDDGLVAGEDTEIEGAGYTITDEGRAHLAEHQERASRVWENGRGLTDGQEALHQSLRKLMGATREIAESGSEEQRQQAVKLLDDLRRSFYGILAE